MAHFFLVVFLQTTAGNPVGWSSVVFALVPGGEAPTIEAELSRLGRVERIRAEEPQAYARMLLDSRLLEVLNHFQLAPRRRDGRFDPAPFAEALRLRCGDFELWITLRVEGKRRIAHYALLRAPVPVDPGADPAGGWSPQRLRRLKQALTALSACHLQPLRTDTYGNTFTWEGKHPLGWRLHAWYVPEEDELRLLLSSNANPQDPVGAAGPPTTGAAAPPP